MGTTPNHNLPYPEGSDTPDIPRDISALARAVDQKLQDEMLMLYRLGAHCTLRRGSGPHNTGGPGGPWTESGSGYTQIRFDVSGTGISNVPSSVTSPHKLFRKVRNGVQVPYDGIYLPQFNAQFEGSSAFDNRLHVMLKQGPSGTENEPGGVFINRAQTSSRGSYRFSFTGRSSYMSAGNVVGVQQEIVAGAPGVRWTFMWVTVTFLGNPIR